MSDENVGGLVEEWPEYVMLRDTKLHDDRGGLGQRIYTTAGAGYTKRKYIRDDIAALSAHGQPVVDAAMIERAEAAWFSEPRTGNLTVAIQRMLSAALGADHE